MLGGSDGSYGEELEKEIGLLLREQRRQEADDHEHELNLYRSGSAPPTVEGSLSAVGGLFGGGSVPGFGGGAAATSFPDFPGAKKGNGFVSEEELRSDPAYLSYYYSNVNLNPRLPPPLLSKEDWRFTQRMKGGNPVLGGIGDRRGSRADDGSGRSLFSMPPGFNSRKQESEIESDKLRGSAEWGGDGLIGLPGLGLGNKQKSLVDIFQVICICLYSCAYVTSIPRVLMFLLSCSTCFYFPIITWLFTVVALQIFVLSSFIDFHCRLTLRVCILVENTNL